MARIIRDNNARFQMIGGNGSQYRKIYGGQVKSPLAFSLRTLRNGTYRHGVEPRPLAEAHEIYGRAYRILNL